MKILKEKYRSVKNYLILLKDLDSTQKLEIISELSNSMIDNEAEKEKEKDKIFFSLSGKLEIDKEIDEFISDIRNSRYSDPHRIIDL